LLFEHSTTVVGAIDPNTMQATDNGLVVAGEVDREGEEGQQVWRAIKSGVAGFSIGFMAESRARKGGCRELFEIDLLEISFTTKPVNGATKVLGWKSMPEIDAAAVADEHYEAMLKNLAATERKSTKPIRIVSFDA
jgi:HK97 family phage prohead protease